MHEAVDHPIPVKKDPNFLHRGINAGTRIIRIARIAADTTRVQGSGNI
jgi:hypothetical protein